MAPKMEPKSNKKGIKNKSDFKTKLEGRPGVKSNRNVPYARPVNLKKTIGLKTQAPKTKNREPRVDWLVD